MTFTIEMTKSHSPVIEVVKFVSIDFISSSEGQDGASNVVAISFITVGKYIAFNINVDNFKFMTGQSTCATCI